MNSAIVRLFGFTIRSLWFTTVKEYGLSAGTAFAALFETAMIMTLPGTGVPTLAWKPAGATCRVAKPCKSFHAVFCWALVRVSVSRTGCGPVGFDWAMPAADATVAPESSAAATNTMNVRVFMLDIFLEESNNPRRGNLR